MVLRCDGMPINRDNDDLGARDSADSLFADPLNVRKGGDQRIQRPPEPRYDGGGSAGVEEVDYDDLKREDRDEEESWNPVTNFFMWMVSGGAECCSMREKQKPVEKDKARSSFPEPPADRPARASTSRSSQDTGNRGKMYQDFGADLDSPDFTRGPRDHQRESRSGDRPADRKHQREERPAPAAARVEQRSPPAVVPGAVDTPERRAPSSAPAGGAAPPRWEWPKWALDSKNPQIEVYVIDEDTGLRRWCEAEPQSRVVDPSGRDAYLCVEYEWDGEYYTQDFGPQHVRRRGKQQTVFDSFKMEARTNSLTDMDETRRAPGRGR